MPPHYAVAALLIRHIHYYASVIDACRLRFRQLTLPMPAIIILLSPFRWSAAAFAAFRRRSFHCRHFRRRHFAAMPPLLIVSRRRLSLLPPVIAASCRQALLITITSPVSFSPPFRRFSACFRHYYCFFRAEYFFFHYFILLPCQPFSPACICRRCHWRR